MLNSTNPKERLNKVVTRCADVVWIFRAEISILRLTRAVPSSRTMNGDLGPLHDCRGCPAGRQGGDHPYSQLNTQPSLKNRLIVYAAHLEKQLDRSDLWWAFF